MKSPPCGRCFQCGAILAGSRVTSCLEQGRPSISRVRAAIRARAAEEVPVLPGVSSYRVSSSPSPASGIDLEPSLQVGAQPLLLLAEDGCKG